MNDQSDESLFVFPALARVYGTVLSSTSIIIFPNEKPYDLEEQGHAKKEKRFVVGAVVEEFLEAGLAPDIFSATL